MALWYDEIYKDAVRFGMRIEKTHFMEQSPFQKVAVVQTALFGRALLLDDIWMTSERDEFYYHEMLVQPAMTTAASIKNVLVIGGGDGGSVREVLRHPEVERCTMVEIDQMVVEACKEHLPTIGSAFDDPRLELRFEDAIKWVAETGPQRAEAHGLFDVIIVDGADPLGPAEGLFGRPFYEACRDILAPHGVLVTQAESSVIYRDTHLHAIRTLEEVFGHSWPYYSSVPIYCGGEWSWVYASQAADPYAIVDERADRLELDSKIYNREYHQGALAIPNRVKRELGR